MRSTFKPFAQGLMAAGLFLAFAGCNSSVSSEREGAASEARAMANDAKAIFTATQAKSVEALRVAWDKQDVSNIETFMTADFKRYTNGVLEADGREAMKTFMANSFAANKATVTFRGDVVYADNMSYGSWTYAGTNVGPMGENMPATNKAFSVDGFTVGTFDAAGLLSRTDVYYDTWKIFGQIGYTMTPPKVK